MHAIPERPGALEYLLLIGGAVVVAVIVIFIMIELAGSTSNAANTTIQAGFEHIQGAIGNNGPVCGDGTCDAGETEIGCPADCGCDNDFECEPERGENSGNCDDCA